MNPVFALDPLPSQVERSIFLAGPTPRDKETPTWRNEALQILETLGYRGVVYVPEPRGKWAHEYMDQVNWETMCLNAAGWLVNSLCSNKFRLHCVLDCKKHYYHAGFDNKHRMGSMAFHRKSSAWHSSRRI